MIKKNIQIFVLIFPLFLGLRSFLFAQENGAEACAISKIRAFRKARLQGDLEYLGDTKIDITYYKLNLNISNSPQYIKGETTVSLKSLVDNLNTFYLDLKNTLTADSVLLGSKKLNFKHQSDQLQFFLDKNYNIGNVITLKIYYQGKPLSSAFGSFDFGTHGTGASQFPIISTLSEPFGAADWFPNKNTPADKADSSDVWITAPPQFVSVSNGKLIEVTNNQGLTKTYKWKNSYPIAQYLISISCTNYKQYNNYFKYSATDSMLVSHFIYPENFTNNVKSQLDQTPIILDILSKRFGLYPFIKEKYGHAQFGWDGGMEHQTCSSMVGFDAGLIAHEMTHQWFGDKITCKNWENIWLNEGFATFGEALYAEAIGGKTAYQANMKYRILKAKLAKGSIYVQNSSDENEIFDTNRSYYKASWVLAMLRGILGDDTFFKVIQTYASSKFSFGVASTEDFQGIAEQVSGQKLDYFFKEWIYGENYPIYTYNWAKIKNGNTYKLGVAIKQNTNTTPTFFTMPIDLKINFGNSDTTITVLNNKSTQNFMISLKNEPLSISIDPEVKILEEVIFDKSLSVTIDSTNTITANEEAIENSWKFSPNPAENNILIEINLQNEAQINLDLVNISGKTIKQILNERLNAGKFQKSISLKHIEAGKYFLRMNQGNKLSVKTIIIL